MCRVVVTGIGIVSPLGHDRESTWRAVCAGASGVGPITLFDASLFPTRIAAEVRNWTPQFTLERKLRRLLSRGAALIVDAAEMAWRDACLTQTEPRQGTIGVVCAHSGTRPHPSEVTWLCARDEVDVDWERVSPLETARGSNHVVSTVLASRFQATGPHLALSTACASGTQALGLGMRMIRDGEAQIVLAGGGDSMISPFDVLAFCAIGALSRRNNEPHEASRPFDVARDGFVLGEGAAMLVLEERDHAIARGAKIYGELSGYGSSLNAYRVTDSPPDGVGPALAMSEALNDAGLAPCDIGYINAHGTSTKDNDTCETAAIKRVFADCAYTVPISSTKGSTGHLISGAGAIEAAFCLLALRDDLLPPTANLDIPDPACDLDYLPRTAARRHVAACLSNSFGFGGTNATVVLQRS